MRWFRRRVNKLGRFSRLSRKDRLLTYEAAATLWFARLWLVLMPFRKVAEKLGTSYPFGPFEWGDRIGLRHIYTLLDTLGQKQNRYLPAPLLKEAALA